MVSCGIFHPSMFMLGVLPILFPQSLISTSSAVMPWPSLGRNHDIHWHLLDLDPGHHTDVPQGPSPGGIMPWPLPHAGLWSWFPLPSILMAKRMPSGARVRYWPSCLWMTLPTTARLTSLLLLRQSAFSLPVQADAAAVMMGAALHLGTLLRMPQLSLPLCTGS